MLNKIQMMQKENEKEKDDPYGRSDFYPFNHELLDDYFKSIEAKKKKALV